MNTTLMSEIKNQTQELKTLLNRPTFEDYLADRFMEDAPEDVGCKDTFADNLDNWLANLDVQEVMDYAEAWGKELN